MEVSPTDHLIIVRLEQVSGQWPSAAQSANAAVTVRGPPVRPRRNEAGASGLKQPRHTAVGRGRGGPLVLR